MVFAFAFAIVAAAWPLVLGLRRGQSVWGRSRHRGIAWTPISLSWDVWRATHCRPAAIAARQQARLADLVAFARARSPYYRSLYRHLPERVADVRPLPPVTKRELMAHFDEWVTNPSVTRDSVDAFLADKSLIGHSYLGRYMVWTTSGSTGEPAILVQDRRMLAVLDALRYGRALPTLLTPHDLWKILRGRGRAAALLVTGGHYGAIALLQREFMRHSWRARITRVFSVLSPLSEIVQGLNAFRPVLIGGYATAVALLAQEQMAGRLRIQPVLVTTTAEWLAPAARERIESAFGCRVWNGYGASEAAAIAFDCRHGWLHVNSDWIILEPVDRKYQPVPPDQPSHTVLVTNLANRVQPIIRYDLGDSVTVRPDPCPCGSPLPAISVEGRTDEILSFPTTGGEMVRLLPMALATVVEETPGVSRFQIMQTAPMAVALRLEVVSTAESERVWASVKQRMCSYLVAQGLSDVKVERAAEPPTRDPRSGKFRHVWAEL